MSRLIVLLLLLGCTPDDTSDPGDDTPDTQDIDPWVPPDEGTMVLGTLLGPEGEAVAATVEVCNGRACVTGQADEAGGWALDVPLDPGPWFLEVTSDEPGDYADLRLPFVLTEDEGERVLDVVVPLHTGWREVPIEQAAMKIAPGLELGVSRRLLQMIGRDAIAGARVPLETLPVPLPEGTPVAAFSLSPLSIVSKGVPFVITDDWDGVDGQTYRVYRADRTWDPMEDIDEVRGILPGKDVGDFSTIVVVRRE